jgi:CRP/FNR family transcriptional regulator, cyclic AMP receptor protein
MAELRPRANPSSQALVAVLDADPDLGEDLTAEDFQLARRRAVAELCSYSNGPWFVKPEDFDGVGSMGLLLVDGLMTRQVTVGDYTCAEVLGPGDVLQPWLRIGPDDSVASEVDWEIVEPVRLAVLAREFVRRIAPWPDITAAISRRIMQRAHWLAFHLAVCGLRRVDDRLLIVLWHFADRWGAVTPEGVRIDVRLTHDVLAAVIGARRPSVSTALKRLTDEGRVRPRPRSRWLLLGDPPPELQAVHQDSRRRI